MKIVAFLQNQWFNDPEEIQRAIDRTIEREKERGGKDAHGVREHYLQYFLFMGCATGRRLRLAFGDLCEDIVWEEMSREVGSKSSAVFPFDIGHVTEVIRRHDPQIILAFGKVAAEAMRTVMPANAQVIVGPHPAARQATVVDALKRMSFELRMEMKRLGA